MGLVAKLFSCVPKRRKSVKKQEKTFTTSLKLQVFYFFWPFCALFFLVLILLNYIQDEPETAQQIVRSFQDLCNNSAFIQDGLSNNVFNPIFIFLEHFILN